MASLKIIFILLSLLVSIAATSQKAVPRDTKSILKECKKETKPEACTEKNLLSAINENIRYPQFATKHNIQGRVVIEYTVNAKGELASYRIMKGIGGGCDRSVINALNKLADELEFIPAKKDNNPITHIAFLPISFKIEDKEAEKKLVFTDFFTQQVINIDLAKDNTFSLNDTIIKTKDFNKRNLDKIILYQADSIQNRYDFISDDKLTKPRIPGCENEKTIEEKDYCTTSSILRYIYSNLRYKKEARNKGIEGMVVTRFIVKKDGTIPDIEIIKSAGPLLDKSAIEVITNMIKTHERWTPATLNGEAIEAPFILPLKFKLHGNMGEITTPDF